MAPPKHGNGRKNTVIRLEETRSAYLLFVPYEQRERAKLIDGYRWDPKLKCWLFPRDRGTFDAIIGEFGDELEQVSASRSEGTDDADSFLDLIDELEAAHTENESLRQTIHDLLIKGRSPEGTSDRLREAVAALEQEKARSRQAHQANEALQAELAAVRASLRTATEEVSQLRAKSSRPAAVVSPSPGTPEALQVFESQLKAMLLSVVAPKSGFARILARCKIDQHLALSVGRELESELRSRLRPDADKKFHELIAAARSGGVLTDEGKEWAHLVRRQRNHITHDTAAHVTYPLRGLLALLAGALIYSELE